MIYEEDEFYLPVQRHCVSGGFCNLPKLQLMVEVGIKLTIYLYITYIQYILYQRNANSSLAGLEGCWKGLPGWCMLLSRLQGSKQWEDIVTKSRRAALDAASAASKERDTMG